MSARSLPIVPAQPEREYYGIPHIALFRRFGTVAEYRAAFGEDPPPFATSLRPKFWFDSSVDLTDPEGEVPYMIVKRVAGNWGMVNITMAAAEAARVNIPPDGTTISGEDANSPFGQAVLRPERELPVRPLLPNEALYATPFGVSVVRLDLRLKQDEEAGKFLPSDRSLLTAIASKLVERHF